MSVFIFFYIAVGVFALFNEDPRVKEAPLSFYIVSFPIMVALGPLLLIIVGVNKLRS